MATTVFLLAHQDDEFAAFGEVERMRDAGSQIRCFYLTNGDWGGLSPARRNMESSRVLAALELGPETMIPLGTQINVSDGALPDRLGYVERHLTRAFDLLGPIERLVVPAWEGGHQDHDAAHWLGVRQAERLGLIDKTRQFGLYRGAPPGSWQPYLVADPLPENGPVETFPIRPLRRAFYLAICRHYTSQRKAMAGLLPFLALRYATVGAQQLQPVSVARVESRPHQGALLYEKRGRYTYEKMRAAFSDAHDEKVESRSYGS